MPALRRMPEAALRAASGCAIANSMKCWVRPLQVPHVMVRMKCNSIQQGSSDTRHHADSQPDRFRPRLACNSIRETPSTPVALRNCAPHGRPDRNSHIGATHGARRWTIQALRRSPQNLPFSRRLPWSTLSPRAQFSCSLVMPLWCAVRRQCGRERRRCAGLPLSLDGFGALCPPYFGKRLALASGVSHLTICRRCSIEYTSAP